MNTMRELILTPEEIFFIGKQTGGKYLDYDYIAAMRDVGEKKKIRMQEIRDALVKKGYAQEDFFGNLEIDPQVISSTALIYNGDYESELIIKDQVKTQDHYKFHHMGKMILSVKLHETACRISQASAEQIRAILREAAGKAADDPGEAANAIPYGQAQKYLITKGTRIGTDAFVYLYAFTENGCYEPAPEKTGEHLMRHIGWAQLEDRAMQVLAGGVSSYGL